MDGHCGGVAWHRHIEQERRRWRLHVTVLGRNTAEGGDGDIAGVGEDAAPGEGGLN
jgi:hypothetical protein